MNRKVLGIAVVLMAVAMLATPIYASPEMGQKVPITITFSNEDSIPAGAKIVGNVLFLYATITYDIAIDVDGIPTYTGTDVSTREVVVVLEKDGSGGDMIIKDSNVFNIDGEEGTFVGQSVLRVKGYEWIGISERAKNHGLLQGTGVFEGQTINAGHNWRVDTETITWTGYWLKP